MRYYFDTSALCRYYHLEPGSLKVEQLVNEPGSQHLISWLTVLEKQSAFAQKVRTGEIVEADFHTLRTKLMTDVALRRWLVVRVLRRQFEAAGNLIVKYGPRQRMRSLDAIHLAIALDLRASGKIDSLVTADALLERVGSQEGLQVDNPLIP